MDYSVVIGKRRFTCLSPTLFRMEFAPDGIFEERRSFVAYGVPESRVFDCISEEKGVMTLNAGGVKIISKEHEKEFFPLNLEVQWRQNKILQYWRPGDCDHRNLGGTVRSLDRYNRYAELKDVHCADMSPPDAKVMSWLSWLQCEDDPQYYEESDGSNAEKKERNQDFHYSFKRKPHTLLNRTLNHIADAQKFSPGVLSRSGYFFLNDSNSPVMDEDDFPVPRDRPGYQDWYLFVYGNDFRQALKDFILLTGKPIFPTKNTFGLIFSRWPAYDEKEAKEIVKKFDDEKMPLSALVLDMEWHQKGWCNWDWDKNMYPDPEAFFKWLHEKGLEVTLNEHPLRIRENDSHFARYLDETERRDDVVDFEYNGEMLKKIDIDICDKKQALPFMRICHDEIVRQGLDYWWVDGCHGKMNGVIDQLVCNKLFYENVASNNKRGMLLSRYGGLGSHRYGVFFTGDTESCWNILKIQCEFNIRAGHLGMGYISHDMGGFFSGSFKVEETPLIDSVLYIRWLQFGIFNPVFRFHSAPGSGSRLPWDYGNYYSEIACDWLKIRNSLLPYIYSAARNHYDTGVPIVRGMFLDDPDCEDAYRFDQFYFGDAILVAPMLDASGDRAVWLPEGQWYEFLSGKSVSGGKTLQLQMNAREIPIFVKAGGIIAGQTENASPADSHVSELILDLYPGCDGRTVLYEDDGKSNGYQSGKFCKTAFAMEHEKDKITIVGSLEAGAPLKPSRKLFISIPSVYTPQAVNLNETTVMPEKWRKIESSERWLIDLGRINCSAQFKLTISVKQ